MKSANKFYVYEYLRSVADEHGPVGSPDYVGKGKGVRAFSKSKNSVPVPEDKKNIGIVSAGMSEPDAFQAEVLLIYLYGRINRGTGCLRNRTDGGEGLREGLRRV